MQKIRDTANRINGFERPKPNEGYAQENDVSTHSIPDSGEKINLSDEISSAADTSTESLLRPKEGQAFATYTIPTRVFYIYIIEFILSLKNY